MSDLDQRLECRWCHGQSPSGSRTCDRCGAPLDVRDSVTDSGWRQAPRLRDMTEFHFGASSCQIDGAVVPVAELALAATDSVFFEHHVMFWKDEDVAMSVMTAPGGIKRLLGDVPFVLSVARGPGRVAMSRDAAGELVVLPIDEGVELDVRGHALLLASTTLTYSFEKVPGLKTMLMAGTGMYLDRFVATGGSGILVLHGYGNVFERTLGAQEVIQVEPGGFLYKDATVGMEIESVEMAGAPGKASQGLQAAKGLLGGKGLKGLRAARSLMTGGGLEAAGELFSGGGVAGIAGAFSTNKMTLMRLTGPGRVGVQSMYQHRATD